MTRAAADRFRILAAAALFSTGGAAIKATTLSGWQVACFRSGIGALAILAMAPEARRGWTWRTPLVGVAYATTVLLFVVANKLTTSANTIYLQSTAPIYLLLLGPWLLKEPLRPRDLAFLGALVVGLALLFLGVEPVRRTATNPVLGNVLAAASGLSWAFTLVGLRWLTARSPGAANPAVSATVAGNVIACVVALPFAFPVAATRPLDWGLVAFLGTIQIALAYVLLTRSVRSVTALEAALLLLLEPVLNPWIAYAVHGEVPGSLAIAGAAVILVATAVHALRASTGASLGGGSDAAK